MTARKIFSLTLSLIIILSVLESQSVSKADILFEKAKYIMETEGDLEKAIKNFQKITKKYPENRKVAAQSLLYTGLCYEKLGRNEATKAYQSLVNNFPGQKNEVAIAKERLFRLILIAEIIAETPQVMTNKKIWEDQDVDDGGEISPDGKYLSYVDWNIGEIALYEIATGKKHKITNVNADKSYDKFAFSPRWAPDSRQIVYTAFVSPELSEIRTIDLEGSKERTIFSLKGKGKWLEIHDLSKDGKTILTTISTPNTSDETTQITLVSIPSGKNQIIKELPTNFVENLRFTANGEGIVYNYPQNPASPEHDIYLLSVDGKTETPLVQHPAHDYVLGLSPDGKQLLFASSRSGRLDFWSIGLENGKTQGNPKHIKTSEFHYLKGLGFSENGAFFYCHFPTKTDVYEIEINPETGEIVTPPHELVQNFVGENSAPDYSSDGKYLAYVSRRSPFNARSTFIPRGNILCVQSLENGEVHEIKLGITNFGFPKWSPDNNSILVVNWEADKEMGIYKIDVQTGKLSLIISDENRKIHHHEWSVDGKSIFLVRNADNDNLKLVKHQLETSKEKVLMKASWKELYTISRSPDGRWLAFLGLDKKRTLKIIPISGGEIREIHTWDHGDNKVIRHCWSADGKFIYLQKYREPKGDGIWNLWQIPIEGGKPKNLGQEMTEIWQISAHPDGRHLAFSNQGSSYKLPEIWMMENFLPSNKLAQNKEPEGIVVKQVWTGPEVDNSGSVSVDGEYLSFVDWDTGDLALRNLKTRENQRITHEATWEDPQQFADLNKISPDGKQVAYYWYNEKGTTDLRVIKLKNKSVVTLDNSKDGEIYPALWFPNGEKIIVQKSGEKENIPWQLSSINVSTGEIQLLKEFVIGSMTNVSLSPDEKYIAFDFPNANDNERFDINLLSIDEKNEIQIIKHPANDRLLGWLPNRNELLFISDRSGAWDLWAILVVDGKPSEPANRIYTDIGEIQPMGFTENGDCFFSFSRRKMNAYIVPFNIDKGELNEQSGKSILGSNFQVKWSSDAKYIAYIKEDLKADNPWQLTVQDLKTGEERKLATNLFTANSPCWSPDGKSILVIGRPQRHRYTAKDYNGGVYVVDVKTGKTTEILLLSDYEFNRPADAAWPLSDIEWSVDGKSIFYLFFKDRLVRHNIKTGREKILYKQAHFDRGVLASSPDGKKLLFAARSPKQKKSHLFTIPVNGGKEIELCTAQEAGNFNMAKWSPDGKYVYFTEMKNGINLWRIPAEGGTPQKVWHSKKRVEFLSIHPDEKQIAFSIRERTTEIRMIEGLVQELEKIDNN